MQGMLLPLVLPLVVGPLSFVAMQALKTFSRTVDSLPPVAKRFAVAAIAVLLTLVGKATGVDLQCDVNAAVNCLSALDQDAVKAVIGAALAYGIHYAKPKKDA
jgi:hypothetical protein